VSHREAISDPQNDDRGAAEGQSESHSLRVFLFLVVQFVGVVFLQKIAIPGINAGPSLTFLLLWAGLPWLLSCAEIDVTRAVLYVGLVVAAFVSQFLVGGDFSVGSFLLVCAAYAPFVIFIPVSLELYRRCLNAFQTMMVIAGLLTIIQNLWQVLAGWHTFPDMEKLLPEPLLMQGYAYIQPLFYGSPYIKPNAFFFLEVSILSQFTACALIIELVWFQRFWHILLYLLTLFSCFAGTGLLIIALVAPLLALHLSRRLVLIGIVPGFAALLAAFSFGWYDQIERRFSEFDQHSSSGYMRFIEPANELFKFLNDSSSLYTGIGAGAAPKDPGVVWWPITKLVAEYGLPTALFFYLLISIALFKNAPSRRVAATLLIMFSLMGSNLLAIPIVNLCLLLGTLLRPVDRTKAVAQPTVLNLIPHRMELANISPSPLAAGAAAPGRAPNVS
jgi:hypothetical protein